MKMEKNVTSTKEVKMLRDFTKSNKEYIKKNKFILLGVTLFLIVGIIIWSIFGLNTNFEMSNHNEFSIKAGADKSVYSEVAQEAKEAINSLGGNYQGYQIFGEGDNTEIVIKYLDKLSLQDVEELNNTLVKELKINLEDISAHVEIEPTFNKLNYVYTASAILLIIVLASLFAYYRYNGASALSIILACILGTLSYICISAILRLSIGASYLAMLVILNVVIVYFANLIFENIRKSNWLGNNNYSMAIKSALQETKSNISLFSIAIMLIGVLFVLFAPALLKYVSINIMFISVVALAAAWYVVPFTWSLLITSSRKKEYKVKATKDENK